MGVAPPSRVLSGRPRTPCYAGGLGHSPLVGELILKELQNREVSQRELAERVAQTQPALGNASNAVKKALAELRAREQVHPVRLGFWALGAATAASDPPQRSSPSRGCVYVYFFPAYKEKELKSGGKRWPCKVGFTAGNALARVLGQTRTGQPEKPEVALVIQSDRAAQMERALHAILKFRGQHLTEAGGAEWFMTTPEEIKGLADFLECSV